MYATHVLLSKWYEYQGGRHHKTNFIYEIEQKKKATHRERNSVFYWKRNFCVLLCEHTTVYVYVRVVQLGFDRPYHVSTTKRPDQLSVARVHNNIISARNFKSTAALCDKVNQRLFLFCFDIVDAWIKCWLKTFHCLLDQCSCDRRREKGNARMKKMEEWVLQ